MIPITTVRFGPEEEALVLEVLRSGQLAQGAYVERFEQEFARLHGVEHAVAVNNGTTALVAALQALDLRPGDEVITTPFTFIATLNAILEAGATARFADIGDDFNVLPDAMSELVGERTRVLMPVHLYGYMADMAPISALAGRHHLSIVEDAAQAVGAEYHGAKAGSFGVGCFSLYATKNINTGEGGVVTTNDAVVADRLRLLRNQGMRQRYQYELAGHNYRMTNLAAAVGIPQLGRLDEITARRQRNAAALRSGLKDVPGLVLPPEPDAGRTHVYHQFTVRVTGECPLDRDGFVNALTASGVGAGVYYPHLVGSYECYRGDPRVARDETPVARRLAQEVFSLPVHPFLSEDDLDRVIESVRDVAAGGHRSGPGSP
jgi:dTDP-4-amino-4,6-dideoxygalactose transaminase